MTSDTRSSDRDADPHRSGRRDDDSALGRHSVLLGSLVLLLIALPLLSIVTGSPIRFPVLLGAVLTAAAFVMRRPPPLALVGIAIAVGTTLASVFVEGEASRTLLLASVSLDVLVLGAATLVLLDGLLRAERVSLDTLVGGACVYLLLGLCFAIAFLALLAIDPGAFETPTGPLLASGEPPFAKATRLLYFSFVTLTTLGYGDLTPASEIAQMMAAGEAVVGQLYLAIFIARLVGLYAGQKRMGPTD